MEQFEAWLERHGAEADQVWVEMFKKHTGVASLNWNAVRLDARVAQGLRRELSVVCLNDARDGLVIELWKEGEGVRTMSRK